MKNNLLRICVDKSSQADERLLTYNDMLELIVVNKIQRGDFDEFLEELDSQQDGDFDEPVDESCECCECCYSEFDAHCAVISKKFGNVSENNSMKFLCAGYTDCMDEAIRFLIEEENIAPEHPLVRNLKAHLEHSKERILDAASQVISRPDVQGESESFPRTEHANAVPVSEFFGDLLRAWNTG